MTAGRNQLVGLWALDPSDAAARERMGDVKMELRADGSLTYLITEAGKKQVMLLRAARASGVDREKPCTRRIEVSVRRGCRFGADVPFQSRRRAGLRR